AGLGVRRGAAGAGPGRPRPGPRGGARRRRPRRHPRRADLRHRAGARRRVRAAPQPGRPLRGAGPRRPGGARRAGGARGPRRAHRPHPDLTRRSGPLSAGVDSVAPVDALWSGSIGRWTEPVSDRPARGRRRGGPAAVPPAAPEREPAGEPRPAGQAEEPVADSSEEAPPPLPVEVVRSPRRRKSSSARIVDGRIVVRVPQWLPHAQVDEAVEALVARLERQRRAERVDLTERARVLARRYDLPEPVRIRWVANQRSRWGSCTPGTGEIRISD